jgi:amidase
MKAKTKPKTKKTVAKALNTLSAIEAARRIAAGDLTSEALVRTCLDRIAEREPVLKAWAHIDPDQALAQARARDREPSHGPLHGVPIGVKDVLDTADMPTAMGSPIYAGNRPRADASCVALARKAGAVILGKTATCELAGMAPAATTHPLDPTRTPGGSSSGSAAAVADHMVPLAFGTQTGGSVIRPAAYCGLVGYKPTYSTFDVQGMKFAARSLDTIGLIARTIGDVALLTDALLRRKPEEVKALRRPPRIGLTRTDMWGTKAGPETKAAVELVARRAEAAGARVVDISLLGDLEGLARLRETINNVERAEACAWDYETHKDLLSPQMQRTIELGRAISHATYVDALRRAESCRAAIERCFDDLDILLAPSANGEAPVGLQYTGDPSFQGMWTLLQVPTITLPLAKGPSGLPVGVQLIGPRWEDRRLLAAAQWLTEAHGS